jgi:hypothetical protein
VLIEAGHASEKQGLTEKTASLVKIGIVRPRVQRSEPLLALTSTAAAIQGSVGASTVPREADEEASIVVKIRWPPVLRGVL